MKTSMILWWTTTTTKPTSFVVLATRLLDQTGSAQIVTRSVPPVAGYWHKARTTIALVVGYTFLLEISMYPANVNLLQWWNRCLRPPIASHHPTSATTIIIINNSTYTRYILLRIYISAMTFIDITPQHTHTQQPLVSIVHIYNLPPHISDFCPLAVQLLPLVDTHTIPLFSRKLLSLSSAVYCLFLLVLYCLFLSSLLYIIRTRNHTHAHNQPCCVSNYTNTNKWYYTIFILHILWQMALTPFLFSHQQQ